MEKYTHAEYQAYKKVARILEGSEESEEESSEETSKISPLTASYIKSKQADQHESLGKKLF